MRVQALAVAAGTGAVAALGHVPVTVAIAPDYRLRPAGYPGGPPWLVLIRNRYRSSLSFYAVALVLLLLLWPA